MPFFMLLAGASALLGFAPVGLYPVTWVCLLPLLMADEAKPWRRRFLEGYLYGIGFYGVGLAWLPDSITSFMAFPAWIAWSGFGVIVAFLALFPAAFKWLLGYTDDSPLRALLVAPALWVALETVRLNAWGGLPWLSLATSQVEGPMAVWLPVIGEPGLGALIVAFNGAIALLLRGALTGAGPSAVAARRFALAFVAAAGVATVLISTMDWVSPRHSTLKLGLAQAAVPAAHEFTVDERDEIARTYRSLAARVRSDAELVVLPEAAIHIETAEWRDYFTEPVDGTSYLVGVLEDTPGGARYNSALIFSGDETAVYRKQRRVPIAEYRPAWLAALLDPADALPGAILRGSINAPLPWRDIELGMSICWEIHFSGVISTSVRDGADLLVNVANESWIRSSVAQQRALTVARMRAAESGRMLLRVVNKGISAVIDADGDVIEAFSATAPLAATVDGRVYEGMTPYVSLRLGAVTSLAAFAVLAFAFGRRASLRKRVHADVSGTQSDTGHRSRVLPALRPNGFTLIELIAVITLLGILAAAIIPRLADFRNEAEKSVFDSMRGSFASGVNLAHAQARAIAATSSMPASITMAGVPIDVTSAGWPAVSQSAGNCTFAMLFDDPGTRFASRDPSALIFEMLLGISTAHALGGGGGGGGGGSCSVLELVLDGESVSDWTTSVAGSVATFTDPSGRSFSYNEANGAVN